MKYRFILLMTLFLVFHADLFSQVRGMSGIHIIPEPVKITTEPGNFILDKNAVLVVPRKSDSLEKTALLFTARIGTSFGLNIPVKHQAEKGDRDIKLGINTLRDTLIGDEGYRLMVTPGGITLRANSPAGIFYGLQTLWQLLPPPIPDRHTVSAQTPSIPCVTITDYPRFGWRGLMLDVSRHFFSKARVEQYIDQMARYKFNVFHWHLTDDNGWRIEIKGLPALTKVGAWRVQRTGKWGTFLPPGPGEKTSDGGYYTQQDIREVVAYARDRFVTIVPEIDVPGHSLALIASYPGLSCTGLQYDVNPGKKYVKREDNVLCVANDSTWLILKKIFSQVAALFPGKYIHVGGDEAYHGFWATDPRDSLLMRKKQIPDPDALQRYFEQQLERMIASLGKKMIGWDEIATGGLATGAAVMTRHYKQIMPAIGTEHAKLVMTTGKNCYLDYYQGDPLLEPEAHILTNRLSDTYGFDPVPPGIKASNVLGGEGCLWTENVPNFQHVQYMTWPRAMALAEVLWSSRNALNWKSFVGRVAQQFKYLEALGINYSRSMYDPIISGIVEDSGSLQVKLAAEIPGLDLYYTFDGTNPDDFSPRYQGTPLVIPTGATEIRVITYHDGRPAGHQITCPVAEIRRRTEKN